MKKSKFVALILSVFGVLLLGIGMCMCLIVAWNLFHPGIAVGCLGLIMLLLMVIIYRKMEHMNPVRFTPKNVFVVFLAILGTLAFGVGMSLSMVFDKMVLGIIIGFIGMILLLCLIPTCKGLK